MDSDGVPLREKETAMIDYDLAHAVDITLRVSGDQAFPGRAG
jgi:hypothetical protein